MKNQSESTHLKWLKSSTHKRGMLLILAALMAVIVPTVLADTLLESTVYMPVVIYNPTPEPTLTPTPEVPEWSFYIVDNSVTAELPKTASRYLMTDRSLQIDSAGVPHLAYYRGGLYYTTFNGAGWTPVAVDTTGTTGMFPSLAFDANDRPHISYYDDTNNHLRYAYWNGTSWDKVTVDASSNDTGQHSSIAVDSTGQPRIAYYDATTRSLKYTARTTSGWTTPVILETNSSGPYDSISLALTSQGWPRIAYHDAADITDNLKFAWWNGEAPTPYWVIETIDTGSGNQTGAYASLAIDSLNIPRISYVEDTGDNLRYTYWTGSTWSASSIDTLGEVGGWSAIAIDSNNNAHIAYVDFTNKNLKYARYTGLGWELKIVDADGEVGYFVSLTLDEDNLPHIAYYDLTNKDIKYARRNFIP